MLGDVATAVGVVVAVVLGAFGLLDAKRSRRLAQKAGKEAESANRIAADALGKAAEANQIAEHANQLSEEANAVAKRSAAQEEEDWYVEWIAEWDRDLNVFTLYQRGRDHALEPSVVLTVNKLHKVYRMEDQVSAGGQVSLPFDEIREQRLEHYRGQDIAQRELIASGVFYVGSGFHPEAKIVVRWKTGLGLPGEQVIEKKIS